MSRQLNWRDSVIVGVAQMLALIPGVSRSGATISAGLFLGLDRELAARFGFLLAIPAVFASGLFSLPDAFHPFSEGMSASGAQLLVATVIAFVIGYPAVAWLLRFLVGHSMYWFVGYRVIAGAVRAGAVGDRAWCTRHDRHPAAARPVHIEHRTCAGGPLRRRRPRRPGPRTGRRAGRADRGAPIRALVSFAAAALPRTLEPLAAALGLTPLIDERLTEVDYGEWTGRKLGELVKEPLWKVVQAQPSAAVFPGGEGLAQVQTRAVAAVREHDRRLADSTAATRCGWPARTATSSSPSSPTRSARTWTAFSAFRRPGFDERDPLHAAAAVRSARQPHRRRLASGADAAPPQTARRRADEAVVGGSTE